MNNKRISQIISQKLIFRGFVYSFIVIIALIMTFGLEGSARVIDVLDDRQHIKLEFVKSEYLFEKCQPFEVNLVTNSIIRSVVPTEVVYSANKVVLQDDREAFKPYDSDPEMNDVYLQKKTEMNQVYGVHKYDPVAFATDKTCQWEAGIYRVRLIYSYRYKFTIRTFSSETTFIITESI